MIYGDSRIKSQSQIAAMEKAWFYERFFIEVVMAKDKNVMVKDKINKV